MVAHGAGPTAAVRGAVMSCMPSDGSLDLAQLRHAASINPSLRDQYLYK